MREAREAVASNATAALSDPADSRAARRLFVSALRPESPA